MSTAIDRNIFGAVRMGYAVIESTRLKDWRIFLHQGLGLHLNDSPTGELSFRMDSHAKRIIIEYGQAEDMVAVGWQLADQATLDVVLARLAERKIAVERSSHEQALQRGVAQFWRIKGPKGLALELFVEAQQSDVPLQMLSSGFHTGSAGMGHVAITSRRPIKMQRFWQEIFDARLSDYIEQVISGLTLDITFLRLNERHHSVAIAATREVSLDPIRTKVQHMNLEALSLEDLSSAFIRCRQLGYTMAHEIGQHPNDKELSFYVISPSGFEIELGWNALAVDEATWQPTTHYAISSWGHKPPNPSAANHLLTNLGNAKQGLRTLLQTEFSPI